LGIPPAGEYYSTTKLSIVQRTCLSYNDL